jgi:hypothetical protein
MYKITNMKINQNLTFYFVFALLIALFNTGRAQTCTNCGVGTNTPLSKFHVKGCGVDSLTSSFRATDSNNVSVLFVRDDKRVGINTIYPNNTLHVINPSGTSGGISIAGINASPSLQYYINSTTTAKFSLGVDYSDNIFKIGTTGIATNPRFAIDPNGQIGFGTVSPNTYSLSNAKLATFYTSNATDANYVQVVSSSTGTAGMELGNGTIRRAEVSAVDGSHLTFSTNNTNSGTTLTERIRVTSTGNVGIGTSTVNNKLDIEGGAVIGSTYSGTNTAPTNGLLVEGNVGVGTPSPVNKLDIEGAAVIGSAYSGTSSAPTNGLLVEGNTSIGTTTATSLFNVGTSAAFQVNSSGNLVKLNNVTYSWPGSQGSANSILTNNGSGTLTWNAPSFWSLTGNSGTTAGTNYIGTSDAIDLHIKTNASDRIVIQSGGDIGMGVSSPQSRLQIHSTGTTSAKMLQLTNATTGSTASDGFLFRSSSASASDIEFVNQENGNLAFYTNNTEMARITSAELQMEGGTVIGATYAGTNAAPTNGLLVQGNVGIGTTSVSSALSIGAAGNSLYKAYVYNSSTTTGTVGIKGEVATPPAFSSSVVSGVQGVVAAGNGYTIGGQFTSTKASAGTTGQAFGVLAIASNATSGYNHGVLATIQGSNNGAGITATDDGTYQGISVPGVYAAYIKGAFRTTDDTPEKPTGGSWSGASDQRLKQNIASFTDGLNILRQINPKTYQFKNIGGLPTNQTYIGVIAQDVQSVFPYCVGQGKLNLKNNEVASFSGTAPLVGTIQAPDGSTENIYQADILTYNQDGLFYVMLNAIKELDAKNTQLEQTIQLLEARILVLEQQ